jgi:hypothetical protein
MTKLRNAVLVFYKFHNAVQILLLSGLLCGKVQSSRRELLDQASHLWS